MEIKLMTFNILHGYNFAQKNGIDLALMADTIRNCGGEIVGLNEVRDEGRDEDYTAQAKIIAQQLGYHWYFAKAIDFPGGPYGNALISKYPILSAETHLIEDPLVKDEDTYYETRCIIKAVIEVPGISGGLTVLASHFGLAQSEKRNAVAKFLELTEGQTGPYVFMGDLNMQPDDEKLRPVYARLKDTACVMAEPKLSCPSDYPDQKIDYIFVNRETEVLSADIPAIVASDHRPHVAVIRL